MKKIQIQTSYKKMLSDVHTPVGIYLRLRDRFRDTILLESTDSHAAEKSFSFICINAIAGIEIMDERKLEYKLPAQEPERIDIKNVMDVPKLLWEFMQKFETEPPAAKEIKPAQSLYGYTTYDGVRFFENIKLKNTKCEIQNTKYKNVDKLESLNDKTSDPKLQTPNNEFQTPNLKPQTSNLQNSPIALLRYRLYQYVIIINHFKDEMYLCENKIAGLESEFSLIESLIKNRDIPAFPFAHAGDETTNLTDDEYIEMVKKGIANCHRGDVFQVVLSRRFRQQFTGDEFNVYRALRSINPSPYLFYFDYGDYKIIGSSPEAQLIIKDGKAVVHPIAGTFKRTGDEEKDAALTAALLNDPKENAEHTMLVDLARNDLSRMCSNVQVSKYKEVQYYSHVIHLVSEVTGSVPANSNPFEIIAKTFPAGTLSGAPKYKAMQLIDAHEPTPRSYYGGCVGSIGFDGSCNHAIMIRTFLSKDNTLTYQAGAGIVAASNPKHELQEVNNKLNALKQAIVMAENI